MLYLSIFLTNICHHLFLIFLVLKNQNMNPIIGTAILLVQTKVHPIINQEQKGETKLLFIEKHVIIYFMYFVIINWE